MSFLYPQNAVFGLIFLFIILFSKKITFTHLEFFQKKKNFTFNLIDLLMAFFMTLALMYPQTTIKKNLKLQKNYSLLDENKNYKILILDDSLSMSEKGYFEDEKDDALRLIYSAANNDYIMIVIFEGDYDILTPFTNNKEFLINKLNSLKPNMVTDYGGSMLRDTVAAIIHSFKDLNPEIYIFSDGSENDNSSVTKEKLKEIAKDVSIKYYAYGVSKNNNFYLNIFKTKKRKPHSFFMKKIEKIAYEYKVYDTRILYILVLLFLYKIVRIRFENHFVNN